MAHDSASGSATVEPPLVGTDDAPGGRVQGPRAGFGSSLRRARDAEQLRLVVGFALVVAAEVWISFNAGGFFAGATGLATIGMGLAFVVWLMSSRHPFHGLTPALGVVIVGLTLFAVWTLWSQRWSHAPARAVIEFDRALLYVLVATVAGLAATPRRRRALLLAVASGTSIVCACALVTRLLPDVWTAALTVQPDRLSYPLTYWNTLGMIGAIAVITAFHVASAPREPLPIRLAAAAAIPIASTTVLLTFSRASLVLLAFGMLLYLALARNKAAIATLPAVVVPAVAAGAAVFLSPGVVAGPGDARAVDDGHAVAPIVLGCALVAVLALALTRRFVEPRLLAWAPPRRVVLGVAASGLLAAVVALAIADAPHLVSPAASSFANGANVTGGGDVRSRLFALGNNGHLEHWRVGIEVFDKHPVLGSGAGTYADSWARYRRMSFDVNDGHSLVVEVLSELGIVGALLIVAVLGALVVGGARRIRGPDRALHAALLTVVVIWLIRAQADWDWEMPALTAPVLACGAALVGGRAMAAKGAAWPPSLARLIGGIALLLLLVTPFGIVRSQQELDKATVALKRDACPQAIDHAVASTDALSSRPEPFQILALCDARLGRGQLALDIVRAAVRRDPGAWRSWYYLAVVRATNGLDPRPQLRVALRKNPRSTLLQTMASRFDTPRRSRWIARGRTAPLPL